MEVLTVAQGALNAFARPTGPTQSVPASAAPATAASPQVLDDDAMLTGRDAKRLFEQYVTPALTQTYESSAVNAYAMARLNHTKDFDRYGPEIQQELAKVPKQYWTLDNIDTVVTLIKGRHRDDYAREFASQLAAQVEPTIRPTGGGSGPVSPHSVPVNPFESEKVPTDWKLRAKQAGITERTIQEFCQANDMTPDDFWKQFDRTPVMAATVEEVSVHGR